MQRNTKFGKNCLIKDRFILVLYGKLGKINFPRNKKFVKGWFFIRHMCWNASFNGNRNRK